MLIENISFKMSIIFQEFDVLYLRKQQIFCVTGMRINSAPDTTLYKQ